MGREHLAPVDIWEQHMSIETPSYSGEAPARSANFMRGTRLAAAFREQLRTSAIARIHAGGLPYPGDERVGQIVELAMDSANLSDFRSGQVRGDLLARMDELVKSAANPVTARVVNITSAESALAERLGGKPREDSLSSQRALANYGATRDGAKTATDYRSELADRAIMENRQLARSLGMGWAVDTDLMRLPRHEVMALAASKITDKTYFALRDMKFSDKGVVAMAEYMNKKGLNINELREDLKKQGDIIGGGDPKKADDYFRAVQQFFVDKKDKKPDAEDRFRRRTEPLASTPQGRKALEETERLLKIQSEKELDNEKKADKKEVKADVKDKQADDLLAALQAEPEKPKGAAVTPTVPIVPAEAAKPGGVKAAEAVAKELAKPAAQNVAASKPPTPPTNPPCLRYAKPRLHLPKAQALLQLLSRHPETLLQRGHIRVSLPFQPIRRPSPLCLIAVVDPQRLNEEEIVAVPVERRIQVRSNLVTHRPKPSCDLNGWNSAPAAHKQAYSIARHPQGQDQVHTRDHLPPIARCLGRLRFTVPFHIESPERLAKRRARVLGFSGRPSSPHRARDTRSSGSLSFFNITRTPVFPTSAAAPGAIPARRADAMPSADPDRPPSPHQVPSRCASRSPASSSNAAYNPDSRTTGASAPPSTAATTGLPTTGAAFPAGATFPSRATTRSTRLAAGRADTSDAGWYVTPNLRAVLTAREKRWAAAGAASSTRPRQYCSSSALRRWAITRAAPRSAVRVEI